LEEEVRNRIFCEYSAERENKSYIFRTKSARYVCRRSTCSARICLVEHKYFGANRAVYAALDISACGVLSRTQGRCAVIRGDATLERAGRQVAVRVAYHCAIETRSFPTNI